MASTFSFTVCRSFFHFSILTLHFLCKAVKPCHINALDLLLFSLLLITSMIATMTIKPIAPVTGMMTAMFPIFVLLSNQSVSCVIILLHMKLFVNTFFT